MKRLKGSSRKDLPQGLGIKFEGERPLLLGGSSTISSNGLWERFDPKDGDAVLGILIALLLVLPLWALLIYNIRT